MQVEFKEQLDPIASLRSENLELRQTFESALQEAEALKQENQKLRKTQQDAELDRSVSLQEVSESELGLI